MIFQISRNQLLSSIVWGYTEVYGKKSYVSKYLKNVHIYGKDAGVPIAWSVISTFYYLIHNKDWSFCPFQKIGLQKLACMYVY